MPQATLNLIFAMVVIKCDKHYWCLENHPHAHSREGNITKYNWNAFMSRYSTPYDYFKYCILHIILAEPP